MKNLTVAFTLSMFLWGCTQTTTTDDTSTTQSTPNQEIMETHALFKTNQGDITVKMHTTEVPSIANNFINLAKAGKYDDTIFHRVIEGFMIQGGDYENRNGTGGQAFEGGMIADEFADEFTHLPGTLSMANRGPNTNGSQFFIMHGAAPHLDGRHAIFGQVVDGMDVVNGIASTETGLQDKPVNDIIIETIEIVEKSS